jgi:hypothetical protein
MQCALRWVKNATESCGCFSVASASACPPVMANSCMTLQVARGSRGTMMRAYSAWRSVMCRRRGRGGEIAALSARGFGHEKGRIENRRMFGGGAGHLDNPHGEKVTSIHRNSRHQPGSRGALQALDRSRTQQNALTGTLKPGTDFRTP